MDVCGAEVTYFNSNWRDGLLFVFCLLLFCAVLLIAVLFLFQKTAINNALISKKFLCDFIH